MRVGAGVGLGDGERDFGGAGSDARQPALPLLLGAVPGDDAAHDRRRHHDQEQRASRRRDLLPDRGQGPHAEPAAAVLLRKVDAQVAAAGERIPELRGRLAFGRLAARVLPAVVAADRAHGFPQELLLLGGHERQRGVRLDGRHQRSGMLPSGTPSDTPSEAPCRIFPASSRSLRDSGRSSPAVY